MPYVWNYLPLVLQILVAVGVAGGMVGVSFFIGKHKNSRYQAGHPTNVAWTRSGTPAGVSPFAFTMVAMLFILFDVEAVFMLPWAVIFRKLPAITGSRMFGFWEMLVYLGFVAVGLFYVWKKGILDWANDAGDL